MMTPVIFPPSARLQGQGPRSIEDIHQKLLFIVVCCCFSMFSCCCVYVRSAVSIRYKESACSFYLQHQLIFYSSIVQFL